MRICLECRQPLHESPGWRCAQCGHDPEEVAGITVFAPSLEASASSYPSGYHDEIQNLESGHFWFKGRNRIILWAMRRYFPRFQHFMEIGCGTGFVLAAVRRAFPRAEIVGSEISTAGLVHAAERVGGAALYQMDALHLPFRDHFDLIGAFDVIEHIENDRAVLAEAYSALKPGGGILITVPQHPWLWSPVDEFAGHFRRYRKRELISKLEEAGFEVVLATSFVSGLLPAMILSRFLKRSGKDPKPELAPGKIQNLIGGCALHSELALIRMGLRLPAGGSLLVAARRSMA